MAAGHSPIFACQTPISKPILIWERKPATDEKYPYGGVKSTDTHLRHVLYTVYPADGATLSGCLWNKATAASHQMILGEI